MISVEQEYLESVRTQQETLRMLKNQIEALMRDSVPKANDTEIGMYVCIYVCMHAVVTWKLSV